MGPLSVINRKLWVHKTLLLTVFLSVMCSAGFFYATRYSVATVPGSSKHLSFVPFEEPSSNQEPNKSLPPLQRILKLVELENYNKNIQGIGKELLERENLYPTFIDKSRHTYLANLDGYLRKVSKEPSVYTVYLRKDFREMKKWLIQDYFDFASNDCATFHHTNKYDKKKTFSWGTKCVGDKEMILPSYSLEVGALDVGLPASYNQKQGREVWTYLHVIQNAIVSINGQVRTGHVTISSQQCYTNSKDEFPNAIDDLPVYDEVLSITQYWGYGFYHYTHETVPRLAPYVQLLNDNPNIKIYSRYNGNKNILKVFGIKNLEERMLKDNKFRAKVMYLPAGSPCGKSPLFTTQLMSLYAKQTLENRRRDVILLIKRSAKRFFKYHDAIKNMLQELAEEYGMELMVFRDDPVPGLNETMSMFNRAAVIVAPHGAGESNMIFAQPGTVLIEGMYKQDWRYNPCYRDATRALGLRFYGILSPYGLYLITSEQVRKPVEFFLREIKFK